MLCGELTCQAEKINVNMPQSSTQPRSLLNKFKYSYIQDSCNLCLSDLYPEKTEYYDSNATSERDSPSSPENTRCREWSQANAARCHPDLSYNLKVHHRLKRKKRSIWNCEERVSMCEIQKCSFAERCLRLPLSNSLIWPSPSPGCWLCGSNK